MDLGMVKASVSLTMGRFTEVTGGTINLMD